MFCSNCGKELPENAKFCDSCGMMVKPAENQTADTVYTPQVVRPKRKTSGKTAAIIIGIVSAAIVLVCFIALLITSLVGAYHRSHNNLPGNFPGGYFDDYDDYGDFFDDYYDFFDDDHHGGYPGYYGNSNPAAAPTQAPAATADPAASAPPLPTDSNGNTYDSPNYQWPTGDGTYEFYAKSTIPKFESVTGKPCTDTEKDSDGNTYYEYDMDMDAYNAYIKAIEAAGYSQSEFDVQGQNSYTRYDNGVQYLVIYLMNSENEIVIMA